LNQPLKAFPGFFKALTGGTEIGVLIRKALEGIPGPEEVSIGKELGALVHASVAEFFQTLFFVFSDKGFLTGFLMGCGFPLEAAALHFFLSPPEGRLGPTIIRLLREGFPIQINGRGGVAAAFRLLTVRKSVRSQAGSGEE
jgi:hypothetical protein